MSNISDNWLFEQLALYKVPEPEAFHTDCLTLWQELCETNRSVNLTRITSLDDFWIKHVLDSLAIAKFFPELSSAEITLADIGCGAGFPSLVLAIAYKNINVTAIDSINKKTAFVKNTAQKLDLNNLQVFTARARELNCREEWQGKYDIITARAVAESVKIFKETNRLLKSDGKIILYKTPEQIKTEIALLEKISAKQAFKWTVTSEFELAQNSGTRQFICGSRQP
jgi:16S rRNA (guanine527-N7)-methyltransferase